MPTLTVQDIVRATQGALVGGDLGIPVAGVSIDSRSLGVGDAFFAIRGEAHDGHEYVIEAAGRGASCLVVHTVPDRLPSGVPLVLVEDTTRALGRLAAWHRARFAIPVIGVTGSNGKTTTKELIAAVLATRWRVLKPEGSFNNQWGLPLTLLKLTAEHQALVVEIGSNHPGEIAALAALAAPTIGVVTTVAQAHTEFFGSVDGVREEKAALIRALPADGHAVLNADDPRVGGMARDSRAPVVTYGQAAGASVRAVTVTADEPTVGFTVETAAGRQAVRLSLVGRHNVGNALAAAAVGVVLGVDLASIAEALAGVRAVKGRCVMRQVGDVAIIDDTYNANPASVRAALDVLAESRCRKVVVLGDMRELGADAAEAHRQLGRTVAAFGVAEFLGVGPLMAVAVEAARGAGLAEAHHAATLEDGVTHLLKRLAPGDVVLVKGSRGMRMERVVDALVARLARTDRSSG
jgi:UDP-N-acetylmuramoyl-tripeptide--D-alanyl-D-alanine ligase